MNIKNILLVTLITGLLFPNVILAKTKEISDESRLEIIDRLVTLLKNQPDIFYKIQTLVSDYEKNSSELKAVCIPSASSAYVGDEIKYTVKVTGGKGKYSYKWEGTDNLGGRNKDTNQEYSSSGNKEAVVTVKSNKLETSGKCDILIKDKPSKNQKTNSGIYGGRGSAQP